MNGILSGLRMGTFLELLAYFLVCCFSLAFEPSAAGAQTVAPYNSPVLPGADFPTNAVTHLPIQYPASPFAAAQLQSPSNSASFLALDDDNSTIPPDTQGAVGPSNVVTMLNSQVRIQNRLGTNLSTVSMSSWWTNLGTITYLYDPRVSYDPYGKRWIAVAAVDGDLASAGLLVAVSQTSDPTGAWYRNRIKVDLATNNLWADYPLLGFCGNWIVVTVNLQLIGGGFASSRVYAFDRTNVYAGGTNHTFFGLDQGTQGSYLAPAVTYDPNMTNMYLLAWWFNASTNSSLRLYTITGPAASPVFTPTVYFPKGPLYALTTTNRPNFASQLGTTNRIFNNDSAISSVVYRNGYLWCAHNAFLPTGNTPTRSTVQWWQIGTNGVVVQVARIEDSTVPTFYAFPSIAVNRFNDVLIGYSRFSKNQYVSANYAFRAAADPPNTLRTDTVLKNGEGIYYKTFSTGANRWGDLSATVVDPLNDADFWAIQEYAATPVGTGVNDGDGRWGTWWGKIPVDLPTNDNFSAAQTISGVGGTTNGTTIRATKEAGEPNHAGIAGGVSIWYSWTAPQSGQVTFDTIGSTFDTLLAVYTGSSVTNLSLIASNDDDSVAITSRVVFTSTSNTVYKIAVDGKAGVMGNVVLNWCEPVVPVILEQPQGTNVVANANENATFSLLACGAPLPLTNFWRFQGTNSGAPTTVLVVTTNSSYTITNVQTNNAGYYSIIVSNSSGSVTSAVATLFVHGDSAARLGPAIMLSNSKIAFPTWGLTNRDYTVTISTNLIDWFPLVTNKVTYWITNSTTNYPHLFYRAKTNN